MVQDALSEFRLYSLGFNAVGLGFGVQSSGLGKVEQ